MRTSALLRSGADQLRDLLLANTTARPNYRVLQDIHNTAKDLKQLCPYAADKARHISLYAQAFYSDAQDNADNRAMQHQRMLELAAQIESAAAVHQHRGN
ncbi:hypothetical protein [Marinobacterium rhizophilum]|uniref:Uncharacterized protein n=1 Tax=Marinobacterium rhizophilum TaxID=420402 RepID=A0ABY5HQM5_9GAMM|nr:hypothetical protein [Marinobacterium rhizophilum]UTW13863.1 hypothetical protein KDW95_09595 [Marinobacterium rhizophilum]